MVFQKTSFQHPCWVAFTHLSLQLQGMLYPLLDYIGTCAHVTYVPTNSRSRKTTQEQNVGKGSISIHILSIHFLSTKAPTQSSNISPWKHCQALSIQRPQDSGAVGSLKGREHASH